MTMRDNPNAVRFLVTCLAILILSSGHVIAESFLATVASATDDASVYGIAMDVNAGEAAMGYTDENRCDVLVRFVSVGVPQGATIDSAFVSLQVSSSQSSPRCHAEIYAEDTASASSFTTYSDYDIRALTDTVVNWTDVPPMLFFYWYRTPDISSVIQEVVDRNDWTANNALALFLRDNNSLFGSCRRFWQYDLAPLSACSLIVYYTPSPEHPDVTGRRRRLLMGDFRGEADGGLSPAIPVSDGVARADAGIHCRRGGGLR